MEHPERILVVRLSHLGDVVHALAVAHALHAAYPRARIGWAIQPEYAALVAGLPWIDAVVPFGRRDGWRAWPRLRRALRDFDADLAVDCQGNLKSAAVLLLSGAPRRAGPARADHRERPGALAINDPAPPAAGPHAMDRMWALARHVAPGAPRRTDPDLDDGERAAGERELDARLPGADGDSLLFHVSSPGDVRSLPVSTWVRLAEETADRGRRALLITGPGDAALGRRLALRLEGLRGISHWPGQSGVRPLAALFTAAARRGARLVGVDSGPAHLAAACGLPVTLVAGPQDERRTGPWPLGEHRVVRAERPPACAPCLARRCTHPEGPVCMTRIEAGRVAGGLAPCG